MIQKIQSKSGKEGFTLIEIIAVLVILAVLAAVAVPRYIDLIDDARDAALEGAIAAGLSHTSLAYGRLALQTGAEPTAAAVATECGAGPESDNYTFGFVAAAGGVNVTATDDTDSSVTDTVLWTMP